ncbi:MAG: hypothetical protein HC930_12295 [Hydrococcus sp. SU_1_0]|nr:hypothetical protein [Hydrococcus sp. SU_1_0]
MVDGELFSQQSDLDGGDINQPRLTSVVVDSPELLAEMAVKAKTLAVNDSAIRLAELVRSLVTD